MGLIPFVSPGRAVRTIQNYVSAGLASNGLPTASDTAEDVTTDSLYDTSGRAVATVAYDANGSTLVPETTVFLHESPVDTSLQTNEIDPDSTDNAAAVDVTLAQTGGVATAATSSASNYVPGDWVLIQGASDAGYDGWFQVLSVPTSDTFTYAVPSGTASTGSGTAQALVAWQHVTAISRSGTMVTATVGNSYSDGQWVSIQGVSQAEYDGWFQIVTATSTGFTYSVPSGTTSTPSGSTIRVRLMNDQTQTSYDVIGEALTSIDQRGVEHVFTYNTADEETQDNVTNFGTVPTAGQTVNQIDTCYDDVGQVHLVTSEGVVSGSETVLNQVEYAYNGWGDETREWQALTGSVDTSSTPSVQYEYADGEVDDMAQYVRLTDVIYPNIRDISYGYGEAESPTFAQTVDNIMSRIATISDASDSGLLLADYTYLGADTIATENLDEPEIKLDYSGSNFAALDQFGNVLNQIWSSYGSLSGGSLTSPITLDGYTYTYNAVADRTSRENLTDSALSELYGNNSLHELTSMKRGTLSDGAIATPSYTQSWCLDSLGNFTGVDNNGTTEDQTVDPSNEIQSIADAATPAYDLAGNMTTTPTPSDESAGLTCVYDAWNRLVEVSNSSGVVEQVQYDGTGRMVVQLTGFTTVDSVSYPTSVTYSLYSGENPIETRSQSFSAGSAVPTAEALNPTYQYVFSALDAKTPILRDTYSSGEIVSSDRLYYLTDANSNVTALLGLAEGTWTPVERYDYDAYGSVTVYNGDWSSDLGGAMSDSAYANTVGFASMVFDSATGLYQDEARWYSTAVSAFISQDPAQADLNTYRYCGDMPTEAVDTTGCQLQWTQSLNTAPTFYGPNGFEQLPDGSFKSFVGFNMVVAATLNVGNAPEPGGAQTWQTNNQGAVMLEIVNGKPDWQHITNAHKLDVSDIGGMRKEILAKDTLSLKIPSKDGVCIVFVGYIVDRKLGMRPLTGARLPTGPNYKATDAQWTLAGTMAGPTLSSKLWFTYWDWDNFKDVPKVDQDTALNLSKAFDGPASAHNEGEEWSLGYSGLGKWFMIQDS